MKITDLSNLKIPTKSIKVLNNTITFELKSIDIEDIFEILDEDKDTLLNAGKTIDTSTKTKFLVTILQTLPDFVYKVMSQCVTNYDNLEEIENAIYIMSTEDKINMMFEIFDLSWSNVDSMLSQAEILKDNYSIVVDFLKTYNEYRMMK